MHPLWTKAKNSYPQLYSPSLGPHQPSSLQGFSCLRITRELFIIVNSYGSSRPTEFDLLRVVWGGFERIHNLTSIPSDFSPWLSLSTTAGLSVYCLTLVLGLNHWFSNLVICKNYLGSSERKKKKSTDARAQLPNHPEIIDLGWSPGISIFIKWFSFEPRVENHGNPSWILRLILSCISPSLPAFCSLSSTFQFAASFSCLAPP